jgi:hypothetical protein
MESAAVRRSRYRPPLVESLERRFVFSSSGAAGHIEWFRAAHPDLSKVGFGGAPEGMITGSADALSFSNGIELIAGRGFVRPLGSVRVPTGLTAYMFLKNPQGVATARVAVGFVDLEKPKGHQWVADLSLEALEPGTTYAKTNTLEYALQRWIPASQPGGSGSFGKVIRSGTATLRFPNGLPALGEATVPFSIVLRTSD